MQILDSCLTHCRLSWSSSSQASVSLIHIYSAGYMAHEEGYYRFFAYLNLFMFSMLVLVLANNFLLMFVGWEGRRALLLSLIGF